MTVPATTPGTVARFDEHRGWGAVRDDAGAEHFFHCTAIADGSRRIEEGAPVRYRLVPGRLGRWEATAIEPR